jgi:arginase
VQELGSALRGRGVIERLDARDAGTVEPPPYDEHRDPETHFLNSRSVMDYSKRLSERLNDLLDRSETPIVFGGDCSILLGNLLALAHRGRYGLLFMDGHTDFYQADANINGEIASSELAIATGREPKVLATLGERALIRDEDVVAFGFRDEAEQDRYGSQPLPSTITALGLKEIRSMGIERAASSALAHLAAVPDGFWIHVDADVLDDAIMPAVDYRIEGGLSWDELETTLRAAIGTDRCVGLDLTIFNPRLDRDGRIAETLVDVLVDALMH